MATRPVDHSLATASLPTSNNPSVPVSTVSLSISQFREIHKNSWLKRLTENGKKITVGNKKSERNWVVFCVHDDSDPLLEGYAEPRHAASHSPEWLISIQDTLHISHALIPNSNEFEFVITLSSGVLRFQASSWEMMQEWVEALRSKLREMKILSPQENFYTKLPEARSPLLPTRDPTSPLPAPPPVPAALVPGVERVVPQTIQQQQTQSQPIEETEMRTHTAAIASISCDHSDDANTTEGGIGVLDSETIPLTVVLEQSTTPTTSSATKRDEKNECGVANNESIMNISEQLNDLSLIKSEQSECAGLKDHCPSHGHPNTSLHASSNQPDIQYKSESSTNTLGDHVKQQGLENVTIIEVSAANVTADQIDDQLTPKLPQESKSTIQINPSNNGNHSMEPLPSAIFSSQNTSCSIAKPIQDVHLSGPANTELDKSPQNTFTKVVINGDNLKYLNNLSLYSKCYPTTDSEDKPNSPILFSSYASGITNIEVNNTSEEWEHSLQSTQLRRVPEIPSASSAHESITIPVSAVNVFTKLGFTSSSFSQPPLAIAPNELTATHSTSMSDATSTFEVPMRQERVFNSSVENINAIKLESSVPNNCKPVNPTGVNRENTYSGGQPRRLTRGATEAVISTRPSRKDNYLHKSSHPKLKSQSCHVNKKSQQLNDKESSYSTEGINLTNDDERTRSSSTSDAQLLRRSYNNNNNLACLQRGTNSPEQDISRSVPITQNNIRLPHPLHQQMQMKRMSLREQQVIQLRREIMHTGGVRLRLRRKDCLGSIAWVEAFGGVWIAGWKQKEHPVLYNALHIGDQLISIAGIKINSPAEANKIIRNSNTLFLEILLRRIPFGRAYAIRREREGQCLGLIRDECTATIIDVIPNSLAARHGLTPKAKSFDGTSLTFWVLTEINGRPLNLFFKDNEIRDRLNSVGLDISILVQPLDLITKIKKQLKSLRSYKEYLL